MFKTIAITTAIMLSTTAIQALDGNYTGGPGPSQSIGEPLKKQSKRDWVHEDHGCGLDCREASAPATKGVPGYGFKLFTTRHNALATARGNGLSGSSNRSGYDNGLRGNSGLAMHTVTSEPFGVFYNLQECDIARAQKIAELDANSDRQPHYPRNAPKTIETLPNGTGIEKISGPLVSVNVSFCEPGIYAPKPSREMAKDLDLETTGAASCATRSNRTCGASGASSSITLHRVRFRLLSQARLIGSRSCVVPSASLCSW